jgi:hypothetical protein
MKKRLRSGGGTCSLFAVALWQIVFLDVLLPNALRVESQPLGEDISSQWAPEASRPQSR